MTTNYSDKIAALLAKAERTDNDAEREAFSAAAERLMMKWGVTDAMAEAAAAQKTGVASAIIREDLESGGTYHHAWSQLAAQISAGLGTVKVIRSGHGTKWTTIVIGTEADIERFKMLWTSLRIQADNSMKAWWAPFRGTGNGQGFARRRQFLLSFAVRVGQRLTEERKEAEAETVGSELVLVDAGKRAQLAIRDLVGGVRTAKRSLRGGGEDAATAGWAAGSRADLSRRSAALAK